MDLEVKVDGLCEAIARLKRKLDSVIEKHAIPRPASFDRFNKPQSKLDKILAECREEVIYLIEWKKQQDALIKKDP